VTSAALLTILSQLAFTVDTASIHLIKGLTLNQIGLLRAFGSFVIVGLMCAYQRQSISIKCPMWQLVRSSISVAYMWLLIYAFSHLPFADATALSYLYILYIMILSPSWLGERLHLYHWVSALAGFVGVLVITRPAFNADAWLYLLVAAGVALNGVAVVMNKWMMRSLGENELSIMFWVSVGMLASFSGAWSDPVSYDVDVRLAACVTFCGPAGMLLNLLATKRADVSSFVLLYYLRLPLAIAASLWLFNEPMTLWTAWGMVAIFLACIISEWKPGAR
jgi:drug/metabolite transporter (DMT)-like permease